MKSAALAVGMACAGLLAWPAAASPMEYLRLALTSNNDYQQALAGVKAAAEGVNVAVGRRLPQLRSNASFRLDEPDSGQGGGGGAPPDRFNANVIATQELINLSSEHSEKMSRLQVQLARARADQARQQILHSVYRTYLGAARVQENLSVIERRRETLEEQLNIAVSSFEVGKSTHLQVLNVKAQLAILEADRIATESDLATALRNLESVAGGRPAPILHLGRPPALPAGDVAAWERESALRPEARAAELEVQVQRANTDRIVGAALPSLSLAATVNDEFDTTYSVELESPLFSSGAATAAKRQSELQEDALASAHQSLLQSGQASASQFYREMVEHAASVKALEASVEVERERLALAVASVELEAGILADALNASTDLAEAELRLTQSRYAQLEAWLGLLAATGGMTLEAAEELEALFR